MENCLFCKIIDGSIPSDIVYRDEHVVAFKDINPQAPVHILVIPTKHIASLAEPEASDGEMLQHVFSVIAKLAKDFDLKNGFRVISNVGEDGGQTVKHLHFHLLGKRKFAEGF